MEKTMAELNEQHAERRERIATACLAAIINQRMAQYATWDKDRTPTMDGEDLDMSAALAVEAADFLIERLDTPSTKENP